MSKIPPSLTPFLEHARAARAKLAAGRRGVALFHGPSGTGKTLAALAIARELGTNVAAHRPGERGEQYIGETEKHIDAVFNEAEQSGAILLFDEADAIFGKRSEVKDSHDRYANIEVSYLLQRIETFNGIVILTSNARQNIDEAFCAGCGSWWNFRRRAERLRAQSCSCSERFCMNIAPNGHSGSVSSAAVTAGRVGPDAYVATRDMYRMSRQTSSL